MQYVQVPGSLLSGPQTWCCTHSGGLGPVLQEMVAVLTRIRTQAYVAAISGLLPEADRDPGAPAARRAEQLGREAMAIGSCLAAGIPRHTRTLYCLKLHEAGPEHSRAPPELWAVIAMQMDLSPQQRQVHMRLACSGLSQGPRSLYRYRWSCCCSRARRTIFCVSGYIIGLRLL